MSLIAISLPSAGGDGGNPAVTTYRLSMRLRPVAPDQKLFAFSHSCGRNLSAMITRGVAMRHTRQLTFALIVMIFVAGSGCQQCCKPSQANAASTQPASETAA